MTEEEINRTLAAATGATETEIADILKADDGATTLTAKFNEKFKTQLDNGDKRATKKTRSTLDKEAKAAGSTHVFNESLSFDENVQAHLASIQEHAVAGSDKALTEEQVLKHPAAVKALNALKASQEQAITDARKDEQQKLATQKAEFTKAQTDAKVRTEAERLVTELNPNFSEDPARKAKQRQRLIDDIVAQGGYQLSDSGEVQLVDADGNLLDGTMVGSPAKFADRVRSFADDLYGLPTSTERNSPGHTQQGIGTPGASTYTGPKEQADYDAAFFAANTPEERKKLHDGWEAYQKTKS